ncbi:MAG: cytochrome C oxidase subunit IV family protein [Gemmatimonadales bacterium]|nr:cytochrome C oxidase subunit IV family protein [Gemmatimonadales bacterium]
MASHSESHSEHAHPTPGLYVKIGVVLFALTALEVLAYEIGVRPTMPLHSVIEPLVVPILLILSAAKFALVAMFYMHLKQDSALLSHLFVWPLLIAAAIILALIVLHEYWIKTTFP